MRTNLVTTTSYTSMEAILRTQENKYHQQKNKAQLYPLIFDNTTKYCFFTSYKIQVLALYVTRYITNQLVRLDFSNYQKLFKHKGNHNFNSYQHTGTLFRCTFK